eukprot:gene42207-57149_t
MTTPARDPWAHLRQHTTARIALGRTGVSLPTRELLDFSLAHAQARDAIHLPLDTDSLCGELQQKGWPAPLRLHSQARDRHDSLLRPALGRRLDAHSVERLGAAAAERAAAELRAGLFQFGGDLPPAVRLACEQMDQLPGCRLQPLQQTTLEMVSTNYYSVLKIDS